MSVNLFDLRQGDILLMHRASSDATKELMYSHAAVVALENEAGTGIPLVFDIIGAYGFQRIPMPRSRQLPWSVYRLNVGDIGRKVASTGCLWLGNSEVIESQPKREAMSSPNVYSRSSLVTVFFGSPSFGPKAANYVRRLREEHRDSPPDELRQSRAGLFSGVTCTFLPIVLYQAVLGVAGSEKFMAIDPRKSLPRDLAKYLLGNQHWEFVGLCEKK